jgi:formiminotetrahydrofolate cyclodeaminase
MQAAQPDVSLQTALQSVVAAVASRNPTPGGGAVMAIGCGLAAALAAMAARYSPGCVIGDRPSEEVADELDRFAGAALLMADADMAAYEHYAAALRLPTDPAAATDRDVRIRVAREDAANVPAAVGNLAASIAETAIEVGRTGNARLRSDAHAAALLASATARGASCFVAENTHVDDPRRRQATADAARAAAAAATVDPVEVGVRPGGDP